MLFKLQPCRLAGHGDIAGKREGASAHFIHSSTLLSANLES